ncbi:MAG TPA: tripartite tricarboxylate transporter TctB family protein [candidate division Zixibacteria bacterium]|nr:tripartite tricarboxylate transporter TctB family protein [candidate division Zixibacteria bacterium]
MATTDRVSGGVLALFSLWVLWESRHLPFGTLRQPGPGFLPVVLAALLLLTGLSLICVSGGAPSLGSLRWVEWRHTLAISAASAFSVAAIERLGYRLTLVLVLLFLVKVVEKQGWLVSLAFASTMAFGSFFLFHTILRVPLPEGPLGF